MTDFARYLNIRSATSPVSAPRGGRVAFLSDITGNYQVWSAPLNRDGETPLEWPQQLTFFADKVWSIHGTAGANHLIAVSDVGGNERQQFYLISNYGGRGSHEVIRLTQNDEAIHRFGGFSSDGQRILFTSNARNGTDFDLYLLDIPSGDETFLAEMAGNRSVLAWSPDEQKVLVSEEIGPLQSELYLYDLAAGEQRHLTADQPPATYGSYVSGGHWTATGLYLLSDRLHDRGGLGRLDPESGELTPIVHGGEHEPAGEFELLTVDGAGWQAAYTYNLEGYSQLWLVNLESGDRIQFDEVPQGEIGSLHFSLGGTTLVMDFQSPTQAHEIWSVDLARGHTQPVTQSDLAGISPRHFIAPTLIHYPSFDDLTIPAFYYQPTTPMPDGGYPCILYVHGGPSSQLRPDFDVRFQYFLSRGYAILGTNVRGSSGYGRTYTGLDELEKRMESVADLKHAVLWLQQNEAINGERVAIYGRSYGGFMVLAALTEYPSLFAAGINVVGISNWVSFLERTSSWRRAHREAEYGSLAHHRDLLAQISPIHKAENITMPLLVIAGDNDPRVPLSESEQIVERVRANGGTVEFLHYADEGHKISKLPNRIDSFTQMADFLDRYL